MNGNKFFETIINKPIIHIYSTVKFNFKPFEIGVHYCREQHELHFKFNF